jgi:hypothetical protein
MPYEAKLPEGVTLPDGYSIRTSDPRYQALEALATKHGLSQAAFSDALGLEARKVSAAHASARAAAPAPAPAPARPGVPESWAKMSSREQIAWSLANGPTAKPRGG